MPYLDKPSINVLHGIEFSDIQAMVLDIILRISNLTIHPLVGRE